MLRRMKDSNKSTINEEFEAQMPSCFVGMFQNDLHFLVEQMNPLGVLKRATASEFPVLPKKMAREVCLSEMMRIVLDYDFEVAIMVWAPFRVDGEGGIHLVNEGKTLSGT